MALSQVQCLDDNHINWRTNSSKPDFFYSEEQRLALERLIQEGRDSFEDYIKQNNIRYFLSDSELERLLHTVEVYCPGSPDNYAEVYGDSDEEDVSLQYWPDRSDHPIPKLDIGWPDWISYRGMTRVHVYTQPPYEGQSHIKEVVRKMIAQAQKVVAIVMDVFTDIDIFKDLLDACYRRKVAVYIMLETTGVKHFLRMCERAGMHTGHLKNMRVRCIRGTEFYSRTSKRVYGSQNQRFMYIDGDKAVSGSYSFTWTASRLDRNLITVLTGQAVDMFDRLFQDMYMMSRGVCLNKINLFSEPEREFHPQVVFTALPSANNAFKLINPKYTLVQNCAFTTNGHASDQTNGQNRTTEDQVEVVKQIQEIPVGPQVHPGLVNIEKANMMHYLPTWPDPEPSNDVIGFINIRDSSKPMHAHQMRSELFEVSQAIRFKDPINTPNDPLSVCDNSRSIPQTFSIPETANQNHTCMQPQTRSEAQNYAEHFDHNQLQKSSEDEDIILPLQSPSPETEHMFTRNEGHEVAAGLCVMKQALDSESLSTQSKDIFTETDFPNSISSFDKEETVCPDTMQTLDTPQPLKCFTQTPNDPDLQSSTAMSNTTHCDSSAHPESTFVQQKFNDKVILNVGTLPVHQDHRDTKPGFEGNEAYFYGWNDARTSHYDSNFSSLSDEYFECVGPLADSRFEPASEIFMTEKPSDSQSSHNQINNNYQEQACQHSHSFPAKDCTFCTVNKQTPVTPKVMKTACNIVFKFSPPEPDTTNTAVPPNTTCVQERDKGVVMHNSLSPVNNYQNHRRTETGLEVYDGNSDHYYRAQTPNGGFNYSSTSEEYFECSDLVGFEPEYEGMVHWMEPNSQLIGPQPDFNQNELNNTTVDSMSYVTQQIQKLTENTIREAEQQCSSEPSYGNMKEIEPEMQCDSQEQPRFQHIIQATVYSSWQEHDRDTHQRVLESPLQASHSGRCLDLMCPCCRKRLEVGSISKSQLVTNSNESVMNSTPQDIATEELQNPSAGLDYGSNHPPNLESAENMNENITQQEGDFCDQTACKVTSEEQNTKENELLIIEDSDLQRTEEKGQKDSDHKRRRAAMSQETKLSKAEPEPIELKTENDKTRIEKQKNPTALVKEKQVREHSCTNQEKKNLSEAKPKLECPVRKPHHAPTRIPIQKQARGKLDKLPSKPDSSYRSCRPPTPKAGAPRYSPGKAPWQNRASISSSPSLERLSTGGVAAARSMLTHQKAPWTDSPNSSTSPPKQPQVHLNGPKIIQPDQPNSRRHSPSLTKRSSSFGSPFPFPRHMNNMKQTFKGTPPSN